MTERAQITSFRVQFSPEYLIILFVSTVLHTHLWFKPVVYCIYVLLLHMFLINNVMFCVRLLSEAGCDSYRYYFSFHLYFCIFLNVSLCPANPLPFLSYILSHFVRVMEFVQFFDERLSWSLLFWYITGQWILTMNSGK